MELEELRKLATSSPSKIVLFVMDGLGGLPIETGGLTELESARTPNLDALAAKSICGLHEPVGPGITPGSGPGHLSLFGYDPLKFEFGRGVLEALGVDFELKGTDVAARGNFATESGGLITDRRAGRISSEESAKICHLLQKNVRLPGVELFVIPVKEHRFALVFRGEGLSDKLTETDPEKEGRPAPKVLPLEPAAQGSADLANSFIDQAQKLLANRSNANMVLLRGFAKYPNIPTLPQLYGLRAAAIASYPMYRGLGKLVGMDALRTGETLKDELATLAENYDKFDYFYVHFKRTDSAGEDGDYDRKVRAIEEVDREIPELLRLEPDVIVVTGDHSTPSVLRGHSWHPVPVMLYSKYCRPDAVAEFSERGCAGGALGRFKATELMPLALANALKLSKFGA
ncbi:MAG: 2,3-bisphosphoglycerate-independent phosphoglycerate mutase [Chloroflexi bacterium]|nr:2,3-bisphosphoglycerate-independent phosphoglycerate mutase [Chloroflexota bacterium]